MEQLKGQGALLRIFISESDRLGTKPLYVAIMEMLKKEKIAGATVLRGICGFGAKSHLRHAHILALSQELPLVIEAVDRRERIDSILPEIDSMVKDGLVTLEKVEVIRYEPQD